VVLLLPRTQTTCRPPPPTFTARTVAGLLALGFELPAFAAWRSTDSEGGEVPSLFGALPAVVGPSEEGIALHVVVNVHWHEVAAESL
jgi:N6-adenosine-specific RNA methylase IME4